MQTHLISYDITDNNLRLRAAKRILQAGAYRIQYSVFMGTIPEASRHSLTADLQALARHPRWTAEDSVLILPLHHYSKKEMAVVGKMPEDWALINRELHTLVL